MDVLKNNFAKKLATLRQNAGMTQFELGEKLSYSDKTVSKWERGEAIPDAVVLKKISQIFSVSVDSLLDDSTEESLEQIPAQEEKSSRFSIYPSITRVILVGIWTVAVLLFVILWLSLDKVYWMVFVYTVPVTLIALLVFNSIWNRGKGNFVIVAFLVLSLVAVVYLGVLPLKNAWQLFLVLIPAELLVYLSFRIKTRHK
ncbi:MAG: helix-turn-helix transcriptional regulator [Oscillospiraceae bacterium]|nr:helix-turn-helix transcriptional regulator [Oscillospiraceae bacterium]